MSYLQLIPPHCAYDRHFNYVHDRDYPTTPRQVAGAYTLINQFCDYYSHALLTHNSAMKFLSRYCVDDPLLLQEFGIGFSDRTLGKQLPASDTVEGDLLRGNLQRIGFLTAHGGETLRGCITYPFKNDKGDVVEIYGERFTRWLRANSPRTIIWSLESAGLFNAEALLTFKEVILCATPLEALMFMRAGFYNVVFTMGMRGFSVEQLMDLQCTGVQRVLVAFEHSPKGDQATCQISQALTVSGIECLNVAFPDGAGAKTLVPSRGLNALRFVVQGARPVTQSYEAIRRMGYDF